MNREQYIWIDDGRKVVRFDGDVRLNTIEVRFFAGGLRSLCTVELVGKDVDYLSGMLPADVTLVSIVDKTRNGRKGYFVKELFIENLRYDVSGKVHRGREVYESMWEMKDILDHIVRNKDEVTWVCV